MFLRALVDPVYPIPVPVELSPIEKSVIGYGPREMEDIAHEFHKAISGISVRRPR